MDEKKYGEMLSNLRKEERAFLESSGISGDYQIVICSSCGKESVTDPCTHCLTPFRCGVHGWWSRAKRCPDCVREHRGH